MTNMERVYRAIAQGLTTIPEIGMDTGLNRDQIESAATNLKNAGRISRVGKGQAVFALGRVKTHNEQSARPVSSVWDLGRSFGA